MFDIHQACTDEFGDLDFDRQDEFKLALLEEFAKSPEGIAHLKGQSWPGWADIFLEYYFDYIGCKVPEISKRDTEEVLFLLFPEKASTGPDDAPDIIAELHAFWSYLGREFNLSQAPKILDILDDDAITELRAELANPRNYGMAKSFFMKGKAAGFDMTTQEGLDAFQLVYNSQILADMNPLIHNPSLLQPFEVLSPNLPLSPGTRTSSKEMRKKKKQQRQARKRNRR